MGKKVARIAGNIITIVFIVVIALSLYSMLQHRRDPNKVPAIFGFSGLTVLSGSMRPYLEPGDMIIDKAVSTESIKVGDVITYRDNGSIVTHRVMEIITENGSHHFVTRGDANNTEDIKPVRENALIGKVMFKIPYGGYVARFVRSPIGLMIFIIIPVALMLVGDVMKVILSGEEKKKDDKAESEGSVHID